MTRLESKIKAGFYALPDTVTDLILSHLTAPHGGRVFDPCAGAGVALAEMAEELDLEPYGAEIHSERADAADKQLTPLLGRQMSHQDGGELRIIPDTYEHVRTPNNGMGLLYLNPPYDYDQVDGRMEYAFLRNCRPLLQPGGILVYVVPQHVIGNPRVRNYLASWFVNLKIARFPDADYTPFKQVVVFGRRLPQAVTPQAEVTSKLKDMGGMGAGLNTLQRAEKPIYEIPKPLQAHFYFRSAVIDPEQALAEARKIGACDSKEFQDHLYPQSAFKFKIRPIMPLKKGHILACIAAGLLDNVVLTDPDTEERLLIKGRTFKKIVTSQTIEGEGSDRPKQVSTQTEKVFTNITTVSESGEVIEYQGDELPLFIGTYLDQLSQYVAETYKPLYSLEDYGTSKYRPIIESLNRSRKIPFVNATGLLPAQKHVVAAVATALEEQKTAIINGEMGCGKTLLGISIAAAIGAKRTLIVCPPHLVNKWKREAEITWPLCRGFVIESLKELDEWLGEDTSSAAGPVVGIIAISRSKMASGWSHAYHVSNIDYKHGYQLSSYDADDPGPTLELLARYRQKYGGIQCSHCGKRQTDKDGLPHDEESFEKLKRMHRCHPCGEEMAHFVRKQGGGQEGGSLKRLFHNEARIRQAILTAKPAAQFWSWDRSKYTRLNSLEASGILAHRTTPEGSDRWPMATYLLKKHKGAIDLLVSDEVHMMKGSDTDQGYAFHRLIEASQKAIGLTGTVYGGKASNLFHLLYRMDNNVRDAFTWKDGTGQMRIQSGKWVDLYGIRQWVEKNDYDPVSGKTTGNKRGRPVAKELPSSSPQLITWLINMAAFISLKDISSALPPYQEEVHVIEPSAHQLTIYNSFKRRLEGEMKERLVLGDKSLIGAWFSSSNNQPDSAFRPEIVVDPKTKNREKDGIEPVVLVRAEAMPEGILPKEQAILDYIEAELAEGRKCLLYCQQTATRDITPRWVTMLDDLGIHAEVLKVEAKKREAWVKKRVEAGLQVLITHPKKVETGLDLLQFPTIIWMGTEFSVFTMLQASRRSFRIGQDRPVKVVFFVYDQTLQMQSLAYMAKKVKAAILVSGDTIDKNQMADMDESGGIMADLAKQAMTGQQVMPDLQSAFAALNDAYLKSDEVIGESGPLDDKTLLTIEVETRTKAESPMLQFEPVRNGSPPAEVSDVADVLEAQRGVVEISLGDNPEPDDGLDEAADYPTLVLEGDDLIPAQLSLAF
jgi:hypothetical protein